LEVEKCTGNDTQKFAGFCHENFLNFAEISRRYSPKFYIKKAFLHFSLSNFPVSFVKCKDTFNYENKISCQISSIVLGENII